MSDVKKEKKLSISISMLWKISTIVLFVALIGVLLYTQPWDKVSENPRTITISGEATIKRAPDSFVFNPSFEADTQEAINAKAREVVDAVKALGLGDAGIQTQVSNYEEYGNTGPTGKMTYTVYLTLSVEDKDLAQKIQDYLATSGASGQISPTVGFTNNTKRELRDEATAKAVEDAKKRAEQTAQNLGVKLGKVLKIEEPEEQYDIYPIASYDASLAREGEGLPINAGESEFPYSVEVEFEIR